MFERYYRELLSFLSRRVADRATAADLAQETYARIYAAEQSGTDIRDPRALLYKTARNLVIDEHRRRAGKPASAADELDESVFDADEYSGADVYEPEVVLASRQRFEAVAAIVDTLPPRCREAFILVKIDGLSHAQAAQQMGISVKTIEMQLQIALDACWDRLAALDAVPAGSRRARKKAATIHLTGSERKT